jgi:hypothetical protein
MPAIFSRSFLQDIFDDSRQIQVLSGMPYPTLAGLESPMTSRLHLPEVRAPAQYLIDMGLQPALAQQLSNTYSNFVAQYKKTCQSHFNHAIYGGCHLPTECYREVFIVLFRRTIQAWDSKFASMVRVRTCEAGALQAPLLPERVNVSTVVL